MFKVFGLEAVDKVLFFLSALVDEHCGPNGAAHLTRVFAMYVGMVFFMYGNYFEPGWSYKELDKLSEKIQKFKAASCKEFSDYQAFKTGAPKWHALDHDCDAIEEVGDLVYLHARLFERSYKRFTNVYSLTSKKAACVTNEAIDMYNKENSRYTQSRHEPESF